MVNIDDDNIPELLYSGEGYINTHSCWIQSGNVKHQFVCNQNFLYYEKRTCFTDFTLTTAFFMILFTPLKTVISKNRFKVPAILRKMIVNTQSIIRLLANQNMTTNSINILTKTMPIQLITASVKIK